MTTYQTDPPVVQVVHGEDVKYTFDATLWLQEGESVSSRVVEAFKLPSMETADVLSGSPSGASPYITQRFTGFVRGQSYLVFWEFATASQPKLICTTTFKCEV